MLAGGGEDRRLMTPHPAASAICALRASRPKSHLALPILPLVTLSTCLLAGDLLFAGYHYLTTLLSHRGEILATLACVTVWPLRPLRLLFLPRPGWQIALIGRRGEFFRLVVTSRRCKCAGGVPARLSAILRVPESSPSRQSEFGNRKEVR